MILDLFFWITGWLFAAIGFGAGMVWGQKISQDEAFQKGREEQRKWDEFLKDHAPEYQRLIPHGNPGHVCSTKCLPPRIY